MEITKLKAFSLLSILLLCSCSNDSDTAHVPEMAADVAIASEETPKKIEPPARVMLQSKELFGSVQSKDSEYAGDPLLEPQGKMDEIGSGDVLNLDQLDYSEDLGR